MYTGEIDFLFRVLFNYQKFTMEKNTSLSLFRWIKYRFEMKEKRKKRRKENLLIIKINRIIIMMIIKNIFIKTMYRRIKKICTLWIFPFVLLPPSKKIRMEKEFIYIAYSVSFRFFFFWLFGFI